jgi:ankyrin repeat protein
VRALLDEGVHPDTYKDTIGQTALLRAAHFGYVGILKALLDKGADPNTKSTVRTKRFAYLVTANSHRHLLVQAGMTALGYARGRGWTDAVQALLEAGAKE